MNMILTSPARLARCCFLSLTLTLLPAAAALSASPAKTPAAPAAAQAQDKACGKSPATCSQYLASSI